MSSEADAAGGRDGSMDDFCVDVRWVGAQDKPYYRATFVSQSRRETVAEEPFRGVAVITAEELTRMLRALEEHGVDLVPGAHGGESADTHGYVVDVELGERRLSASLGDERRSIPILTRLRDALEAEHRKPLDDVLTRLGGWIDA